MIGVREEKSRGQAAERVILTVRRRKERGGEVWSICKGTREWNGKWRSVYKRKGSYPLVEAVTRAVHISSYRAERYRRRRLRYGTREIRARGRWSRGKSNALSQDDLLTWPISVSTPCFPAGCTQIHPSARHRSPLIAPSLLLFLVINFRSLIFTLSVCVSLRSSSEVAKKRGRRLSMWLVSIFHASSFDRCLAQNSSVRCNSCFPRALSLFSPPSSLRQQLCRFWKSWTHYAVIYGRDNRTGPPTTRGSRLNPRERPAVGSGKTRPASVLFYFVLGACEFRPKFYFILF